MSRNLDIDFLDEDPTDELPVLAESELSRLAFEAGDAEPAASVATESTDREPTEPEPADDAPTPGRELQADLMRLFERIGEFEALVADQRTELERQRHELAEQRQEVAHWRREAARHETRCSGLEAALAGAETGRTPAAPAEPVSTTPTDAGVAAELARQREEIASLADYIAARNEHIHELEIDLRTREIEIAQLMAEVAQRSERERQASAHANALVARADALARRLADTETLLAERSVQLREARLKGAASEPAAGPAAPSPSPSPSEHATRDPQLFMAWPPAQAHASLVCMTSDEPTTYPLAAATTITIGRGPECELQIPTHYVSREHARLVVGAKNVTVEDLSSRNGVFVNNVRVQSQQLRHGDLVTIGETQFRFVAGGAGQ